MAFVEWQYGQQQLAGTQSHWFGLDTASVDGESLVISPYTTNYGTGAAPWTVTLTSIGLSPSGTVAGSPVPIATYATGFNFSFAETGLSNNTLGVAYTVADGTYPASSAVGIDEATLGAGNQVTSRTVLLSDIGNLQQFRIASAAAGGASQMIAYSTYDPTSKIEQIHLAGFTPDGTPIAGQSSVLESLSSPQGYDAFGFGTLTPSTSKTPSYLYLRGIANNGSPAIAYETVSPAGVATSTLTAIQPGYSAGSANRQLLDWVWDRVDPTASSSNDLATVALLSDTSASGTAEKMLDVQVQNAAGGPVAEDIVSLTTTSTNLTMTRLSGGGFIVGYTDVGMAYLREYDDNGDVVGLGSYNLPNNPAKFGLEQMADGRLLVAYQTSGNTTLSYDIFTLPTGPIAYYADKGVSRRNLHLDAGDNLTVKGGGYAADTTVNGNGSGIVVLAGGLTARTVLNGDGGSQEYVLAKGATIGTIVNGASQQIIVSGATATGTVLNVGGTQQTGGTTRDTLLNGYSYQFVGSTGIDFDATLKASGNQWLNGQAYGAKIEGGDQSIMSGGSAYSTVITSGDQDVGDAGRAGNTTVNGGSQYIEGNGTAMLTTVNSGGQMTVEANGSVWGALINGTGVAMLQGDGNVIGADGTTGVTLNGGTIVKATGAGISRVTTAIVSTGSTAGTIESASGTLEIAGTLSGPLALKSDGGARLVLDKAVDAGSAFTYNGAAATLLLNDAPEYHGSITGLASGEKLDLRSIADGAGHMPSLSYAPTAAGNSGTLSVSDGSHVAHLNLIGTYASSSFHLAQDGVGGSLITVG